MPQQINLRAPILLTQKHYLSANNMALSLAVIAAFSVALCGYWVWSLEANSAELDKTLNSHVQERERLQAALKMQQSNALPAEASLMQELQARQTLLQQREQLLSELGRGLLLDGQGHSARLRLVAQTIPAEVWLTEVRADERQMQVQGFTLEPAALNQWVARLEVHPLLLGHALSAVKVERVAAEVPAAEPGTPGAAAARARPSWSFSLVSTLVELPASGTGGRP
jgi:Tfp pilus assembly protein PilN